MRIGNHRRLKVGAFRTGSDRSAYDHPVIRITVLEVSVVQLEKEGIEVPVRVDDAKSGLATITVDFLSPGEGAKGLERAVVLRAALHVERIVRRDRQAVELKRAESVIQARNKVRHS